MKPMTNAQYSNFTIITMTYHALTKYCLWYLDENDDEYILKEHNAIVIFETKSEVRTCLSDKKIQLNYVSFDTEHVLSSLADYTSNHTLILEFINIVADIAKAANIKLHEKPGFHTIYDKLFYGENLSTINTSGKKYQPVLDHEELQILQEYLEQCVCVVKNSLFPNSD